MRKFYIFSFVLFLASVMFFSNISNITAAEEETSNSESTEKTANTEIKEEIPATSGTKEAGEVIAPVETEETAPKAEVETAVEHKKEESTPAPATSSEEPSLNVEE